ncbi:MAG TPA: DegT/DnrJ/EryC1/StrS family aminotransferase [Caulobacterales bacterium]|nr:DegT/DnrJ/EryC1/StrS family aminotransferase [Caulobacterales bacterium]
MSTQSYLPIARPKIGDEEIEAVGQVLRSGWLTQGAWVKRFETEFAARHEVPFALATTSCTTALHLALASLDVGPGDEVIVPAFTWIATANVVVHCGARPVLVDVEPDTYNIDVRDVARKLSGKTKAVMPVHLFGLCADMDALAAVLPSSVRVVEDAACAAGAAWHGRPAGALADMGCFSFHPRKSVTCGEGGMLTIRDPALARRAEMLRNHGAVIAEEARARAPKPYELPDFAEAGFNYRMTDLQAAVGVHQLRQLDAFIEARETLAALYDTALAELQWLSPPLRPAHARHSLQAYVVRVGAEAPVSRDDMLARLHEAGIGARPGTHSIADLSVYQKRFGLRPDHVPVSSALARETLALPLHNHMGPADVERVIGVLRGME